MNFSLSKITWSFVGIGFLAPLLLEGVFVFKIQSIELIPEWLFFTLWPAFGFLMASDTGGGPDLGKEALGFVMSVAANAIVYLLLGSLVSLFYRRILQSRFRTAGE
jgi:hypothetical protein